MTDQTPNSGQLQPMLTFISIVTVGIIIAVFIVDNQQLRAPIIIISFIIAGLVTAFELRYIVRQSNLLVNEEREKKVENAMARYVAKIFDEDIPFDELNDGKKDPLSK